MKNIYLDNAATTKIDKRVLNKMMPYFETKYGNASSIHFLGQENDLEINACKKEIAKVINGEANNIVFTSSATEANNLIIKGVMRANKDKGKHFLISIIEHPCVLASARELLDEGFEFDYIPVDKNGVVILEELKNKIRPDTVLISVMTVNNEIGTIQPIVEIGKIAKSKNIFFHTDAVQSVPYLKIDIKKWQVDFLSLSGHKFYGPQGVGMAYVNKKIKIKPIIVGGGQEDGLRSGTYNMAGIVGFTEALKISYKERLEYIKKVKFLRNYFWKELNKKIKNIKLNGSLRDRTPNNLNIMFESIEGEAILIDLSLKGIYVSTGSACSAQNLKVSSVIKAIGVSDEYMNSNIRFTFGRYNNEMEVKYVIKKLIETVNRLRKFSSAKHS
ncbi:cysteine desulfurase NifS [Candidatus Falkowbacteria bacterium HGW-Falkowbacteria-1]|jgi:cysteine desulfurase|uniref:cysteine desulfurase n=1 Tax=Candidatus Falkowbacteria bacterium HGW-Falkowbacteria-1 TaxID=2013768 RepID=A0A2N2E9R0_9BACT|nr:MAG: cysteine desulfurase NifS [Candidatus Falkowbacteria bacterium HGW-Falkowbacteria-1]